ncbi:MAG: DUF3105 domain-containing protein [Chloroflexi bacterium]|nr:DUF3105 domain-containing protein [Chloroflexota bacterium]
MSRPTQRKPTQTASFSNQQRSAQIRLIAIVAVAVLIVSAGIWYIVDQTIKGEQDKIRPDVNPAEQIIPSESAGHVDVDTPLIFKHYPPSSGTHYGTTMPNLGFYDQPWPEGYWVHNLEHGDVVVLYNCGDDCANLKAQLKALVDKAPQRRCPTPKLIVLPYSQGMTTPISVIAWGRQLDVAEYDEKAILDFYKRYEDRGPETVACSQ